MDHQSIQDISSMVDMKTVLADMLSEISDAKSVRSYELQPTERKTLNLKAKQIFGEFLKSGMHDQSLKNFSESKAFSTDQDSIIEENISSILNETAISNTVVLREMMQGSLGTGSPFTIPKLATRPTVLNAVENKTNTVFNPTDAQTYTVTTANFSKSASMPIFTHEAISDSIRDIESDVTRLIAEERAIDFIAQTLFGDGTQDATTANLKGLLTHRIDVTNSFAESLKEDDVRDVEFLKILKTGVDGGLPVATSDIVDLLIEIQMDINFEYQAKSKWFMSKEVFKKLRKLKVGTDDNRPLLAMDFGTFSDTNTAISWSLLGKPVVIVDALDEFSGTGSVALFYGDLSTTLEFGLVTGSADQNLIIDNYTFKGSRGIYSDSRFYSVLHNNDAVRVVIQAV